MIFFSSFYVFYGFLEVAALEYGSIISMLDCLQQFFYSC